MKKKWVIGLCILLAVILLVPFPIQQKDGGTVQYRAILYSVYDLHRIDLDKDDGFQDGIIVEVLGIEIFNNAE